MSHLEGNNLSEQKLSNMLLWFKMLLSKTYEDKICSIYCTWCYKLLMRMATCWLKKKKKKGEKEKKPYILLYKQCLKE